MRFWVKILYQSKAYGALYIATEWFSWQGSETWKHRQFAEENAQDGYNCPVTRQQRSVFEKVEDLVISQED